MYKKLFTQINASKSILCIGLDPRVPAKEQDAYTYIIEQNKKIIDATYMQCACYKPNVAFYEQHGEAGLKALHWTLSQIPTDIPVILDAKRGDIGSTSEAYAAAAFKSLGADAITLSPYMGTESIEPFLAYKDKLLFILVRTSNPGADEVQLLPVKMTLKIPTKKSKKSKKLKKLLTGKSSAERDTHDVYVPLFQEIAARYADYSEQIGFVVGANCYSELSQIRRMYPTRWILAPGIGAQGANIQKTVLAGIGEDGFSLLPVISRGIANSDNPKRTCLEYNNKITLVLNEAIKARRASNKLSAPYSPPPQKPKPNELNSSLEVVFKELHPSSSDVNHNASADSSLSLDDLQKDIITKLFEHQCVRIGKFTLKSGLVSPFYIDLRKIISFPDLFELATKAYIELSKNLHFDCIAGIPTASLPFAAALAREVKKPMIYPRLDRKSHGSGNLIEGYFSPNSTVLVLDDLISQGSSKIETLNILHEADLQTQDIVVLICRGYRAYKDMHNLDMKLHYFLHIDDIIQYGQEGLYITSENASNIKDFLRRNTT